MPADKKANLEITEGRIARMGLALAEWSEKWFPDPLVFAFLGVIVNAYDSVPTITRQIRGEIEAAFGQKVFSTVLSKSIRIEEAIALRRGVIHHGKLGASRAADEVRLLGDELLSRLETGAGGAP